MSKLSLDMSQFKHLKSDKKSTTLQHAKLGHTITLDHASLSKQDLSALDKMPKDYMDAADKSEMKGESRNMAKGGKAKKYADGGEVDDTQVPQGLDPQAPAASLDTATQPDLSADMNNFNDPAVIQKHQQIAQALQMDPENFRRGLQMALAGTLGPEGAEMEEADTAAKALNRAENKGYGKTAIVEKAPKPWEPGGKSNWTPGNDGVGVQIRQNVPKFADGGDVPEALSPDAPTENLISATQYDPNEGAVYTPKENPDQMNLEADIAKRKEFFKDSWAPSAFPEEQDKDAELQATKAVIQDRANKQQHAVDLAKKQQKIDANYQALGLPASGPAQPTQPQAGSPMDARQPAAAVPTLGQSQMDPSVSMENAYQRAYDMDVAGAQNEAKAVGQKGVDEAAAANRAADAQQLALDAYQSQYKGLEQERQAHMDDIRNGYIDPNQYWTGDAQGNGSHSKIMAGIGMMLAGFNPTNNPNAATAFLNQQLDRNIAAQKENLGAKQNLLTANLRQFGNLKDAEDMTRIMQNDVLNEQMTAAASKNKGPIAQAQAQQLVAQKMRENEQLKLQMSMRRAMMGLNGMGSQGDDAQEHMINYLLATDPAQGKAYAARRVKGVGMSTNEVPDSVRQQISTHKAVNDLMNTSLMFSQQHSSMKDRLNPEVIAQATAIQGQLIGQIKQAQHDGVYKPSEADFLTSQIGGSPASFMSNFSSVPKIKQLQQIKQQEYNELLKTNGFNPQQLPTTQPQQGPQIKTMGGKQYQKVPGGWTPIK